MIPRANGVLAAAVSLLLGIAAHGIAGGYVPDSRQLLMLGAIAVGVGAVRSAQRSDSCVTVIALLSGGQVASHIALSMLSSPTGHQHDTHTLAMLGWHAAALPASAAALCVISWFLRFLHSTIDAVVRATSVAIGDCGRALRAGLAVVLHHLTPRLSVGMRAPPVSA
ncbi:hypothetical protein [Gordonia sp. (in: high G+C Gram-positive bacteria)]|uniref:hypothetical protein n=1 Tax=unclassified Gordonia (in: high G+C Gram-positive bacteria) TaxID=2657482 RepID=UPI002606A10A|nr:hypothetical protein [Gordonia sp. (in: high G+C Gram-positive bacteria)]